MKEFIYFFCNLETVSQELYKLSSMKVLLKYYLKIKFIRCRLMGSEVTKVLVKSYELRIKSTSLMTVCNVSTVRKANYES